MMGTVGVRAQFGALVHAHAALGKPTTNLRLGLQCMTHVAPTDAEAYDAVAYARWQTRAAWPESTGCRQWRGRCQPI